MVRLLPALLVLLCGCGADDIRFECAVEGVGAVLAEHEVDCDIVMENVEVARAVLLGQSTTTSEELAAVMAKTTIVIKSAHDFTDPEGTYYASYQSGTIRTNSQMYLLSHEMTHAVLEHRTGSSDADHESPEWKPGGTYRRADIEYTEAYTPSP